MDSWRDVDVPDLPGRAPETMIWDTASAGLVVAAHGDPATIYACGITPYDATHIGHAATYVAWDLLVRAWRDAGHEVRYVQNVTDVDDPLLERAAATGQDWRELADRDIALYRSDMEALRVLPPARYVGAVEAIGTIERFNAVLAEHGALYDLDGDTYFARSADPRFGAVSGLDPATMAALSAERGGDPGRPGKKDPLDPLVWLAARPGEPAWESEFGSGRPGWHVECAAIATQHLGTAFDVQAGGSDLIFPHHEMSASHARVALAEAGPDVFARRYAHAGMVRLDGEKMSKSLGNLVFVSALLSSGTDPMAIRLAILAHHYRRDWDWTQQGLAAAGERLARWRAAVALGSESGPDGAAGAAADARAAGDTRAAGDAVLAAIRERLADDLDAPGALAVIDRWAADVTAAGVTAAGVTAAGVTAAGRPEAPARLIRSVADALLGVAL